MAIDWSALRAALALRLRIFLWVFSLDRHGKSSLPEERAVAVTLF